jgi:hypothetical protein
MNEVKDTARASVRLGYDGRVHKTFRGPQAAERFANEVRVLQYLEQRGCPFVPRLLAHDPAGLVMVTTNCGGRVERMDDVRVAGLFAELESYGVRHEDRYLRNITYSPQLGRFCLIDFEFATILDADATETEPPAAEKRATDDMDRTDRNDGPDVMGKEAAAASPVTITDHR